MVLNITNNPDIFKIYISYEIAEKNLASEFKGFIERCSDNNIEVYYQEDDDRRVCVSEIKSIDLFLVLCSPYSIAGSRIHFESGAASFLNTEKKSNDENQQKNKPVIIPICHSGLLTAELPQYLSSNQGITIKTYDNKKKDEELIKEELINAFGKELIQSLGRESGLTQDLINDRVNFYDYWKSYWSTIECSNPVNNIQNKHDQSKRHLVSIKTYFQDGDWDMNLEFSESSSENQLGWNEKIKLLSRTLSEEPGIDYEKKSDPIFEIDNAMVAIGVLPFLWDGDKLYVGLRKTISSKKESKPPFHSGTIIIDHESSFNFNEDDHLPLSEDNNGVKVWSMSDQNAENQKWYQYIVDRLESVNSRLWYTNFSNDRCVKAPSVIFLNDSDDYPRLDIGLIRIIDISASIVAVKHESTPSCDWIWAKDGKIKYWYFAKSSSIPKNKYVEPIDGPVFLKQEDFENTYGYYRFITPYASDEEIREGNLVSDTFTVSARQLLTCF